MSALAITALAAAITFGANLARLVDTPRLYGQSWDVTMDAQFALLPRTQILTQLRRESAVSAWTFGVHNDVTIDGHEVPTIGLTRGTGSLLAPTIIDGRAAVGPREIMLGNKTLNQLHRRVGQTITARFQAPCCANPGRQPPSIFSMRIVGRAVFPFFGEGGFTPTGLGVGAQVASAANTGSNSNQPINFVLVRVAPGPDHDIRVAPLVRDLARPPLCASFNQCSVSTTIRPTDILNYTRVQSTPVALAAVLAILAFGVLANLLVSSIRRRRRELAILKTLGFAQRQVSAAVAWQATTLVALALAIGLPVGATPGRSVWASFATNLGVAGNPQIPLRALIIAVPVAITIGNLIAALPGILASQLPPANVLRTL